MFLLQMNSLRVCHACRRMIYPLLKKLDKQRLVLSKPSQCRYTSSIPTILQAKDLLGDVVGIAPLDESIPFGDPRKSWDKFTTLLQEDLPVRKPQDSFCRLSIPLGSDPQMREKYMNIKKDIRFGRILEDLDTLAGLIAYRHSTQLINGQSPLAIVTASVDRIEMKDFQLSLYKDIILSGNVTWAGRSSMEITMNLHQENEGSGDDHALTARFVMVARHPITKMAADVNRLQPDTEAEQNQFKLGEVRKLRRQDEARKTLLKTPPSEEEKLLIHNIFLDTIDQSHGTFKTRKKPDNAVWMEIPKLKNICVCFPESRNLYGKIFGGYIMRKAFELAWTNAAFYCKSRPYIRIVDDIIFRKPVEVGSLLFLSSQVVYTKKSFLMLKVHAEVVDLDGSRVVTNDFHFTFDSKLDNLPNILPKTYAESMIYLDGKRRYEEKS